VCIRSLLVCMYVCAQIPSDALMAREKRFIQLFRFSLEVRLVPSIFSCGVSVSLVVSGFSLIRISRLFGVFSDILVTLYDGDRDFQRSFDVF
jgi:hypothetical protein